jgi:hypothetical protein
MGSRKMTGDDVAPTTIGSSDPEYSGLKEPGAPGLLVREAPGGRRRPTHVRQLLRSYSLLWLIIFIGAALRLYQYLIDRSLSLDESQLALNIERHGVAHLLTHRLDLNQGAPAGFLLIERLAADTLGKGEYALRAFALFCGLVAIPLFVVLALRTLSSLAVPIAAGFYAASGPMIYHSSEVKQYATDTMAALAIAVMSIILVEESVRLRRAIVLGLLGAVLIQLSFAAVITAGAMGGVVLAATGASRRRDRLVAVLPTLALWAGSSLVFLMFYVKALRGYELGGDSVAGSTHLPAWLVGRLRDLSTAAEAYHSSSNPWVLVTVAVAVLAALGAVSLMRRKPVILALLLAPGALLLVLGAAGRYSILPRSILFVVPFVFLLTAEGIATIVAHLPVRLALALAAVVAGALIVDFASFGGSHAGAAIRHDEIKDKLAYVVRHWRPGDVLYIHHGAQYAFAYYADCGCLRLPRRTTLRTLWPVRDVTPTDPSQQFAPVLVSHSPRVLIGATFPRTYDSDIDRISRHKRAWVLVTFTGGKRNRMMIRRDFDRRAKRLYTRESRAAELYLYSFAPPGQR